MCYTYFKFFSDKKGGMLKYVLGDLFNQIEWFRNYPEYLYVYFKYIQWGL